MVYFGINRAKNDFYFSKSLTDLAGYFGINHQSIRNKFSSDLSDSIEFKGINIYKGELNKIQGRGRDLIRL